MVWDQDKRCYVPDGTWRFDSRGAAKAIEILGNTIGMFETKIKLESSESVEQYLKRREQEAQKEGQPGGEF